MTLNLRLFIFVFSSLCSAVISEEIPDVCPNIIKRVSWGGVEPRVADYMIIPVENVIIQHTATPSCTTIGACSERVQSIQNHHMNVLNFHDIGLNFLIGNDGNVYEGAGWHKIGAHTRGYNTKAIGIAFIGSFGDKLPSQNALEACENLLECGVQLGELDVKYKLFAHSQISATQSPGMKLSQEVQKWPHWTRV